MNNIQVQWGILWLFLTGINSVAARYLPSRADDTGEIFPENKAALIIPVMVVVLLAISGFIVSFYCWWKNHTSIDENVEGPELELGYMGASRVHIESFPTSTLPPEIGIESPQCSICLEDYAGGDQVMTLPICRHVFHTGCVTEWFSLNTSCPLCRHDYGAYP